MVSVLSPFSGGTKRAAIMKATSELVAEHGFHGTSMAMIAERAGVAAGSIYRYFESKDELMSQTYLDLELRLFKAAMAGCPAIRLNEKKFLQLAGNLLRYCITSPIEMKFLEQFRISPFGIALRREKMLSRKKEDVAHLFYEAVERQLVKDLPPTVLFDLAFGPLFTLVGYHHLGLIGLDGEMIGEVVERCWKAIRR